MSREDQRLPNVSINIVLLSGVITLDSVYQFLHKYYQQ